jgi:lipopolysaccharide heptosyltransferase I
MSLSNRSPRILIVRLSAVGDTILTMPVLCALREKYPQAHLAWAAHAGSAALLRGHEALDDLYVVPKYWHRQWSAFHDLRRWLWASKFDVVLDAQGLTKSAGIGFLAGAKRRIGFTRGEFSGREFSMWLNNELVNPTAEHVVDQHLELLRPLGIENPRVQFKVPRLPDEVEVVDRIVKRLDLEHGYVLIQPGAGWPSKLWPSERYAAVARWLWKHHGMSSMILWSGQEEQQLAKDISAAAPEGAHMAPSTSLPQLAELCRRATMFVGPDTGPLHLAAAVGTVCVGLYGPMSAARCGPYGSDHIALQNACLDGGARARRTATNESMKAILAEEVCAACDRLLLQRRRRAG